MLKKLNRRQVNKMLAKNGMWDGWIAADGIEVDRVTTYTAWLLSPVTSKTLDENVELYRHDRRYKEFFKNSHKTVSFFCHFISYN